MVISLFVNSGTVVGKSIYLIYMLQYSEIILKKGVFAGKKFFDQNMPFCIFISAACLIACGTSLLTMGILAFNRLFIIV